MTALHSAEYELFLVELRAARERAGISQYALADRLGVDQSLISKIESGRRRLDVVEFLRIMAALDVDYSKVVERIQEPARQYRLGRRAPPSTR